ncbi:MAG TPA: TRAP transporter substrate-binding protein [Burkholderiaceae bacterium]|nr:TRAP transporter substrate-binding protein [Burkholderiaceae bacterium]
MLTRKIAALVVGASAALSMATASAQQTTLNVSTWLPPSHVQNRVVWPTWAQWVEDATEGRVKVNIEYTSSNPGQLFEMVEDGVTDAAFSFHGFIPGRFDLQEIVELPGLGTNAEGASAAHWRTYQKYLAEAGEHEGLELLALFTHGPGVMQTNFPVSSLDDLKGKKIRVGGGVQAEIGKRLEITPVAAPGNKVYELLQTGVVDGVFMPVTEQKAQRLFEVAPYITMLPQGMYLGSFTMFISPDFLDSISPEDAEAIRSVSGEKLSIFAGRAWDAEDTESLEFAREQGVTINLLDADDPIAVEYAKKMEGLDQAWLDRVASKGVDAEAALAMLRSEAANYKSETQ